MGDIEGIGTSLARAVRRPPTLGKLPAKRKLDTSPLSPPTDGGKK